MGICLESIGLTRIIEACNVNANIKQLNIGVLTDDGLQSLAQLLRENTSLEVIEIQETKDPQKLWSGIGRGAFTEMLKKCTVLKQVILNFTRENEPADQEFTAEIQFYTEMKTKEAAKKANYMEIMRSCDPKQMFENL